MFNIQGSELIFLLLIALVILGPEKLPDAVRKFGRTYAEFKKFANGFQGELKSALDEPMRELRETADAVRVAANFDFDADTEAGADAGNGASSSGVDPEERARRRAAREARGERQGPGRNGSGGPLAGGAGAIRPTIKAERSTPLNFGDPSARTPKAGAEASADASSADNDADAAPGEDAAG